MRCRGLAKENARSILSRVGPSFGEASEEELGPRPDEGFSGGGAAAAEACGERGEAGENDPEGVSTSTTLPYMGTTSHGYRRESDIDIDINLQVVLSDLNKGDCLAAVA
jgi:hypothetical protein